VRRVEAELARRVPERALRGSEDLADFLRGHGPLPIDAIVPAVRPGGAGLEADHDGESALGSARGWLGDLEAAGRAVRVALPGAAATGHASAAEAWAAIEDAGLLRDALGVELPPDVPEVFLEPTVDPVGALVARFARSRGPFT